MQNAKETVAPVFTKVNSAAKQQYSKALENERVHYLPTAVTAENLKPADGDSRAVQHPDTSSTLTRPAHCTDWSPCRLLPQRQVLGVG